MANLIDEKCTACHPDSPAVTETEIATLKSDLPNWSIDSEEGNPYLKRIFKFPDFAAALAFTNRVGELAEAEGHHPALLTEWGKVTVSWWTHAIAGLHRNDFIMAAKTDQLYK